MELKININLTAGKKKWWKDTGRKSEHIIERMRLRGIGVRQIKEAVQKGAKKLRDDQSIIAEYRWYKVVYREFRLKDRTKIYPITVIEV